MSNGAGGALGAGTAIHSAVGTASGAAFFPLVTYATPPGRVAVVHRLRDNVSSALKWPNKDPDEIEDFVCDWTARLQPGDAIASSLWIVPVGITMDDEFFQNNVTIGGLPNRYGTTIWLSGGTLGQKYTFVNRIATTGGRSYDQSIVLKIKTR